VPTGGRRNLAMSPVAFLDQPDLVRIAPVPTPRHVLGGQDLDVRCERKVDHKVGLTITQCASSDGPRRSVTTYGALWQSVGQVCDLFTDEECYNFFKAAGYETD